MQSSPRSPRIDVRYRSATRIFSRVPVSFASVFDSAQLCVSYGSAGTPHALLDVPDTGLRARTFAARYREWSAARSVERICDSIGALCRNDMPRSTAQRFPDDIRTVAAS